MVKRYRKVNRECNKCKKNVYVGDGEKHQRKFYCLDCQPRLFEVKSESNILTN